MNPTLRRYASGVASVLLILAMLPPLAAARIWSVAAYCRLADWFRGILDAIDIWGEA